ncbi:hypothetical protein [Leptolyngbya sp. PCC 6406]|uniref:hypothetical protein n=1 Tax=Leptolyngbya sp. PCC 6406 TaxID=1173264 RepID=UPI0002D8525B|nr:hypothetical protein [Leptolyngbya sp. PCC 6406]
MERSLNLTDTYRCPLCRQGDLQALTLIDAFACNFCRHILTADLDRQEVQVVDSSQPITWTWTGQRWQSLSHWGRPLTPLVWITTALLLSLPAGVVSLAGYLFPPLAPAPGLPFSLIWAAITFAAHFLLVLWLLAEHYQFPIYVTMQVRLLQQRPS